MQPRSTEMPWNLVPGRGQAARSTLFAVATLILAGVAAYSNSFDGPFIFDDGPSILQNRTIRRVWPLGPILVPKEPTTVIGPTVVGRPLLNLSLALNYAWGGTDVRGYHIANLAIHLLAGVIFFGVVRRTLQLPKMPENVRRDATGLALTIALIWTLHPLQTESVTYVVQRAESIVGVFYFLMLYCVVRGAMGSWGWLWYVGAALACTLGTATKEVMVTAPVVVLAYDRVFLASSFREILRKRWGLYAALLANWWLLAALMRTSASRGRSAGFGLGMKPWDYAMTQFGAIVGYLRLSFWPDRLILDYGDKVTREQAEIVPYAIVIGLLVLGTVVALWRRPWIGFLGLWFFAILAPTSSVVPLITQTIAEHRMYLPLAAVVTLCTLAGYGAWNALWSRFSAKEGAHRVLRRWMPAALVVLIVSALGCRTYLRNQDYRTAKALWEDNVRKDPNGYRALSNLGVEYFNRGDLTRALELFDKSIALKKKYWAAWMNRGSVHFQRGEFAEALADYNRAVALNQVPATIDFRGQIHERLGNDEKAFEDYTAAIELDPNGARPFLHRGLLAERLGNDRQAIADFSRALQREPVSPEAYYHRGDCRMRLGEFDRAIEDFTAAISQQLNPADPVRVAALYRRGMLLGSKGQPRLAVDDFTSVIEQNPTFADAYLRRALGYQDLGQKGKARQDLDRFAELGGKVPPELVEQLKETP